MYNNSYLIEDSLSKESRHWTRKYVIIEAFTDTSIYEEDDRFEESIAGSDGNPKPTEFWWESPGQSVNYRGCWAEASINSQTLVGRASASSTSTSTQRSNLISVGNFSRVASTSASRFFIRFLVVKLTRWGGVFPRLAITLRIYASLSHAHCLRHPFIPRVWPLEPRRGVYLQKSSIRSTAERIRSTKYCSSLSSITVVKNVSNTLN